MLKLERIFDWRVNLITAPEVLWLFLAGAIRFNREGLDNGSCILVTLNERLD